MYKEHQKGDFGFTGDLHESLMSLIWGPGANVAIFLVLYSYRQLWVWAHSILFLFAGIYTIATAIPILLYTGIIYEDSSIQTTYSMFILNRHYIIGIASLSGIALMLLLGITLKLLNIFSFSSALILIVRSIHKYLGYLIVLTCKANMYIITKLDDLPLLIIQDAVFALLLFARKLKFPKMEQKQIVPKWENKEEIMKVRSLKEIENMGGFIIFANYIFKTDKLKTNHPAGFQLIETVKNIAVDRYIYGSATSEELPQIPPWSHSFRCFTLIGRPIAHIDIPQTFAGFQSAQVQCKLLAVKQLSEQSSVYHLSLAKKKGSPFKWLKYQEIGQLGRYFSLTINQKVTRLYTNVNFLVEQNVELLKQHMKWEDKGINKNFHLYWSDNSSPEPSQAPIDIHQPLLPNEVYQTQKYNDISTISTFPLMIKAYPKGQLTQHITDKPVNAIILSESKGEGLQLPDTKPGKIIIVAGGTGIFPFCDLIDLLYKEQIIEQDLSCKESILGVSPILKDQPFKKWTFELLAAFNRIDDMHPITFEQLLILNQRKRMKIILKIKEKTNLKGDIFGSPQTRFEQELSKQLQHPDSISKVWICGPPAMNQLLVKLMKEKQVSSDLYLVI